jgi:RNA polymerase sigma-70 factor (ECF subfamily)
MDSEIILSEIRKKNHFIFKKLFETHYKELVIYANQYLFDKRSSEDVVQEVFIYLWDSSNKINVKTNLKAYLYAMVRNRCLNTLKSIKITYTSNISEIQTSNDSIYMPDWFPEKDNQILYNKVLNIIENLPVKMRTIVKLRFIENYNYHDIANELGISVNTVKTQLKRAKIKFAQPIVSITILLSIF